MPDMHNFSNQIKDHSYDAVSLFEKIPGLVFFPHNWSSTELAGWNAMDHHEKLTASHARMTGLPGRQPVLPFDLRVDEAQLQKPAICFNCAGPVTVYVAHKPYVGPTEAMRAICKAKNEAMYVCDQGWEAFADWLVPGMKGIVDALQELYESEEDYVEFYKTVHSRLIRAGDEAARMNQAYAFPPRNDNE